MPHPILYLPGAGGSADFWKPVAEQVGHAAQRLSWPGLGQEAADPQITSLDDLVTLTISKIHEPVDLVAQSMGGYVAIRTALAVPAMVRRLVLVVTSGGVSMPDLGGADWRSDYFSSFPNSARWIANPTEDLSHGMAALTMPILLIWGDSDPISPIAVGEHLAATLPDARLVVIGNAGHDLARTHADQVARLIADHLR